MNLPVQARNPPPLRPNAEPYHIPLSSVPTTGKNRHFLFSLCLSPCVCLASCIYFSSPCMCLPPRFLSSSCFFSHILLSSSLSFFLVASSVWSFLFLIFNPHSPSHMTHWKTNSSYWRHSEVVRDEKTKTQGRRWQWEEFKWEKGHVLLCFRFYNIAPGICSMWRKMLQILIMYSN